MTPDEIVRALRCCGNTDTKRPDCEHCPANGHMCVKHMLEGAADLIESLQADLRHEEKVSHGQMEQNKRLRKMMDKLQANLAESQRRERTAVEDIEKMMRICEKGSCHFCADGDCTNSPMCTPKWRGPREDGKGEAK